MQVIELTMASVLGILAISLFISIVSLKKLKSWHLEEEEKEEVSKAGIYQSTNEEEESEKDVEGLDEKGPIMCQEEECAYNSQDYSNIHLGLKL